MINATLGGAGNFDEDDDYYDHSDAGENGSNNDDTSSESGSDKPAAEKISTKKSAAAVTKAAAPAPAPATKLPKKLLFDTSAAGLPTDTGSAVTPSMTQFAEIIAMAMRNTSGIPASFGEIGSNIIRKTLPLVFIGTLSDLQDNKVPAQFKPEVQDIGKYFGGNVLPVTKISILGYDFTNAPISLGPRAPAHFKEATHNHIAPTGPVLFAGDKLSKKEFDKEIVVYRGVESEFKKHVALEFPGVNEKNVFECVREGTKAGWCLVPTDSIVAAAVNNEITHQKEECIKAGSTYTGPELAGMYVSQLDVYNMPKPLVNIAVNCLIKSFVETNDSFDLTKKLYFEFTRTALSPSTIEKQKSANAPIWTDPRELASFLRDGASIDSFTQKTFIATLMIAVEYNGSAAEKK
jgi:hypothetical protein